MSNKQDININIQEELKRLNSSLFKDYITQDEIDVLLSTYEKMRTSGRRKYKQIRKIVPIEEWLDSAYYVGQSAYDIYPYWKEHLIEIFSREQRPTQIIITGAIGTGKTHISTLILIRIIYELSCYENMANFFKLDGITRIALVYLSVTKVQAENSGYTTLKDWIDTIPYFKEHFPRNPRVDSQILFDKENILGTFGSNSNHFIGMSVIAAVLDEANFKEGRQVDDANEKMNNKAAAIYSQLKARAASRFIVNGKNHSMSILTSSTTSESSFTEQMIEEALDDPYTYVVSPSQWDVKPNEFSKERFVVYAGGDGIDAFIVRNIEEINHLLEIAKEKPITHTRDILEAWEVLPYSLQQRMVKIPVEFRQAFQGDIIQNLQDLAGYSVSSSGKFFSNVEAYDKAVDHGIVTPFIREDIVLSTTNSSHQEGYLPIESYIKPGFRFKNPSIPRYIHLDLALTNDSAGIAMSHISEWRDLYQRDYNSDEGDFEIESRAKVPIVTVDLMLEIKPPKKPQQISFAKIRDFLLYLREVQKVNIALITFDQFQSAQMRQELVDLGFNVGYLSVDRTTTQYDSLAGLYYDRRIKHYEHQTYKRELFNLIKYTQKRKIDHPLKGSKDTSDAVAGSVFNAISAEDKTDITDNSLMDLFMVSNQGDITQEHIDNIAQSFAKSLLGIM